MRRQRNQILCIIFIGMAGCCAAKDGSRTTGNSASSSGFATKSLYVLTGKESQEQLNVLNGRQVSATGRPLQLLAGPAVRCQSRIFYLVGVNPSCHIARERNVCVVGTLHSEFRTDENVNKYGAPMDQGVWGWVNEIRNIKSIRED
jgi:hypothetical protein